MNTPWKRLLQKTAVWLVVEVMMNLTGLDTLADFSEFLFDLRPVVIQTQPSDLITALHQPPVLALSWR